MAITKPTKKGRAKAKELPTSNAKTRKWDVDAARIRYITDPTCTMKTIAEEFNIGLRAVEVEAKKREWVAMRIDYGESMNKEIVIAMRAKRDKIIQKHLKRADGLGAIAANTMQRMWNKVKDDPTGIPDIQKLKRLADTLKIAHDMERQALQLPTTYSAAIGKDGELADAPTANQNVVNIIQLLDAEIDRAKRNGVIDAEILE